MKPLLCVSLTCALLLTAESLRCHMCANEICSNSTSVVCPAMSTVCSTVTSVTMTDSVTSVTVNKNCSTLLSCFTLANMVTEWSVNQGIRREARTQMCCITDNCNFPTLAVPNTLMNGKQCPACASLADSIAGTCNATLSCVGVEDSCFSGTTTSNSTEILQLGCISRNLCGLQTILSALPGVNTKITCAAPWSIRISAVLLTCALMAHEVLV